jgi:hypothetical protein
MQQHLPLVPLEGDVVGGPDWWRAKNRLSPRLYEFPTGSVTAVHATWTNRLLSYRAVPAEQSGEPCRLDLHLARCENTAMDGPGSAKLCCTIGSISNSVHRGTNRFAAIAKLETNCWTERHFPIIVRSICKIDFVADI